MPLRSSTMLLLGALFFAACGDVEGTGGDATAGGRAEGGNPAAPARGREPSGGSPSQGGSGGAPFVEPGFDSIEWKTGPDVGFGVASKDTLNPTGENAFIGYAGYAVDLASAQAWVREL